MDDNSLILSSDTVWGILLRFSINVVFIIVLVWVIYFRYTKKEKFLFTFFLIGVVVFFVSSIMRRVDIGLGLAFGLFALIKGYTKTKGYQQLLNQYELMNVIYSRAESKAMETETYNLDTEKKNAYLKELFFVVGKEALIENGNWYLIFKEREPEIRGI